LNHNLYTMTWLVRLSSQIGRISDWARMNWYSLHGSPQGVIRVDGFDSGGFSVHHESSATTIKWTEISKICAFKTDQITIDRIDAQILCTSGVVSIHEHLPGWTTFVEKSKEALEAIPGDWELEIIQPPFASNFTTIYEQSSHHGDVI